MTLFLPPDRPSDCVQFLQSLGCEVQSSEATHSLRDHGFCRVHWRSTRVDVFLPLIDFYEDARQRRKTVDLGNQPIVIWDAETLAVVKMMFFRRKDLADVEQVLRTQGPRLDRKWIRD